MKHRVYLALGSNLGDRLANLQAAWQGLEPQVEVLQRSPVYETPPWGVLDQPMFLNMVLEAQTELSPLDLLNHLKALEQRLGRQPALRYGPRTIDLDLLLYDDWVWESPELSIPHPRLAERAFVLVPLADLAPGLRHPVLDQTVAQLLSAVDQREITCFDEIHQGGKHAK